MPRPAFDWLTAGGGRSSRLTLPSPKLCLEASGLLAQGEARAAARSLSRSLADPGFLARERRIFLLPVHVSASLAAGDEEAAAASAAELEDLARRLGTPGPSAAAAVARGELALHRGDTEGAIASLQEGVRTWCEVDAPYEAGRRGRRARPTTPTPSPRR